MYRFRSLLFFFFGLSLLPAGSLAQQVGDSLPETDSLLQEVTESDSIAPEVLDEFGLSTPRQAVNTHLYYLQDDHFFPHLSIQALDGEGISEEELQTRAIQLKQIYDGLGFFVDIEEIPNDPEYQDSLTESNKYIVYEAEPEIYLTLENGRWRYAARSVRAIENLHKRVYPFGSDILLKLTPQIGNKKVLGLKVWQLEGILILALLAFFLFWILRKVFDLLIRRFVPMIFSKGLLDPSLIAPVARPLSLLLVTAFLSALYPMLLIPPTGLARYFPMILKILTSLFGVIAAYRLVDLLASVSLSLTSRTETTMDDQLIPLVRKIGKMIVVIIGVVFVLQNLNVDVTTLLAGISIGGLALALAAQDTVKNFIGSITIFVDRPFQVGDFIDTPKGTGSVVEVGVRSTRIRALDGALISIPNGEVANLAITNHGMRSYRRYSTNLGLAYGTHPDVMERFVEEVRTLIFEHPHTRDTGNLVYFHEMGDSSLNIFIAVYFELTDYGEMLRCRQELFLAIMRKAESLGVSFAFPSRSLYIESMPSVWKADQA